MNKRQYSMCAVAAIVLVSSLVLALIADSIHGDVVWAYVVTILITEAIVFLAGILTDIRAEKHGGAFIRLGAFSILIVNGACSILTSLIFLFFLPNALKLLLIIQVILAAVSLIALIALLTTGATSHETNRKYEQSISNMQELQSIAEQLAHQSVNCGLSHQFAEIAEAIRFSDNTVSTPEESEIYVRLSSLKTSLADGAFPDDVPVQQLICEIQNLLAQRAQNIKQMKAGRI